VAVAQLAQPGPVAGRRHEAAAGVLHRLGDEHRHRVGRLELDRLLDLVEQRAAERRLVAALRVAVAVGGRHERGRHAERLERRPARRDPRERQRPQRGAVVGDPARDGLAPLRLAARRVVLAGELPRRLHRLRAARGEEHALQPGRRELGDPRRQLDRARVRDGPVRRERQLAHLRVRDAAELVPVGVAEVRAVQAGQPVDVAAALGVVDVAAVPARDHQRAVLELRHVGEVQEHVLPRGAREVRATGGAGRRHRSTRQWSGRQPSRTCVPSVQRSSARARSTFCSSARTCAPSPRSITYWVVVPR